MQQAEAIIIGASILDIPAGPVDASVFSAGSHPVGRITLGFGGDALNEATTLTKLGHKVRLVSLVGQDEAGSLVLNHCKKQGINTDFIQVQPLLDTGINLVLVSPNGQRSFITSSSGGLRALQAHHIPPAALQNAKLMCFASMFVFPLMGAAQLASLFAAAKKQGLLLCADITKRKQGETAHDMREALQYIDYIFPNYEEAALLTGKTSLDDIANVLLHYGVKQVVIKTGEKGCFVKSASLKAHLPAYPNAHCIDTTGAGDTFAAGFLCALLEDKPPLECARFANAAASLAIEHFGATGGVQNKKQVLQRLQNMP